MADREKTRTLELPSDSHFAVALKNQQQAEREEQQRIKNLVLNLDMLENEDQDGELTLQPLAPNANIHNVSGAGHERASTHHHNRTEKQGKDRGQRVRKLEISDVVDKWYGKSHETSETDHEGAVGRETQQESEMASTTDGRAGDDLPGEGMNNKRRKPGASLKSRRHSQKFRPRRG